ncbi:oligosaccharide flippase family protein [Halosimplex halophilum]|uniref:oligosaccharide flippase family protein n=1 Tax=Halosimplex halophilum TaxID=2559572 RepID=UPI00107F5A0D|nr:polysaccharide biosynthesis C-terminal domain-containing protein [Halosimplex halophilum]
MGLSTTARAYLSVLSGDVGRLLTFALFIPVVVRVVGDAGFGRYALVMAVFMPLRKVTNLGLFQATKARASVADRPATVVGPSLVLHLCAVGVAATALAGALLAGLAPPALARPLWLLVPALVGEQLFLFGRGTLHALRREALVEPLMTGRSVVLAVVGTGLAAAGHGVAGVFTGFAVAFLLSGLVATALALRAVGLRATLSALWTDDGTVGRLVRFGVPSMALALTTAGLYKVDVLLVGYYLGDTVTGHYRAALQVAEFVWVLPIAMQLIMIQSTAALWEDDAVAEVDRLVGDMLEYVVVGVTLLLVGLAVLGGLFLELYFGPSFVAARRPLVLLLPGVFGFSVARSVWPVLQAGGYLRVLVGAGAAALATNVALNLALVPRYGIAGAALATTVSYALLGTLHLTIARRASLSPLAGLSVGRLLAVAGATLAVLVAGRAVLPGTTAVLVALAGVGGAVYAAGAVALGVVDPADLRDLATG